MQMVLRAAAVLSTAFLFSASEGWALITVGALDTPGQARGVALMGDLAYVADDSSGLRVINVSNPALPVEIGALDTPSFAVDVHLVGNLAYVADAHSGLRVIDVSNPALPVEIGALDTPDFARTVEVVGDLAYVADDSSGLRVIDVSDPALPVEIGVVDTGQVFDVEVVGNLAYLASSGLRVIDVSNPALPVEIGASDTASWRGVAVVGNLAYVVGGSGLAVIDVSNPALPVEIGALDTPDDAWAVEVVGALAYLADGDSGLRVIDVSNPTLPVELTVFDTPGRVYQVEVVGALAYLADGYPGLRLIDVSDPALPVEIGALDTPDQARGVAVVGDPAYVADDSSGLRLMDFGPEYHGTIAAEIDIRSWSDTNPINPLGGGLIPVAILGSESFDVADVDMTTLAFGPNGAAPAFDLTKPFVYWLSHWDVNHDGKKDLLSHYRTDETGIAMGDTEACLTGEMQDGTPFEGCDAINTAPSCGHPFEAAPVVPAPVWIGWRKKNCKRLCITNVEVCDAIDNDCDGLIDENVSCDGSNVIFYNNELLTNPDSKSAQVSVVPAESGAEMYVEYGKKSGQYTRITPVQISEDDVLSVFVMDKLKRNRTYYYRLIYKKAGEALFRAHAEKSFKTKKSRGKSFTFVHMTDSHIGKYLDISNRKLDWRRKITSDTIDSINLENPDFVIDTGDTYMTHMAFPATSQIEADFRYSKSRNYYEKLNSHYLLCLGNHEGELNFSGVGRFTARLMEWSENSRFKYLPSPYDVYGGGEKGNYYAFEWGDALFVILDSYRYNTVAPQKADDWVLGYEQMDWLNDTLRSSSKKWKFVFSHHILGGDERRHFYHYGDGGGKYSQTGDQRIINDLMEQYNAQIFFYGHVHLFAHDWNTWSSAGTPGSVNYVATSVSGGMYPCDRMSRLRNYENHICARGYTKVEVNPDSVTFSFINYSNRDTLYSYTIYE